MKFGDIVIPLPSPAEIARHEALVRRDQEYEARRRRREAETDFERNLPAVYRDARLDAPWLQRLVGTTNLELARRSIQAPRVVFMGPARVGKTSLATAMLRARGDHRARFVHAVALGIARLSHRLGETPECISIAEKAPLVLLDDLGEEADIRTNAVPEIITLRHACGLPTWITTGRDPQALAERYGGGRGGRIFESAVLIGLRGPHGLA